MNEDQKKIVLGIVAAIAVIAAVAMYFAMFPLPPKSPSDAGIGLPAKPGGGVEESTPYGDANNPYGPGGAPPSSGGPPPAPATSGGQ